MDSSNKIKRNENNNSKNTFIMSKLSLYKNESLIDNMNKCFEIPSEYLEDTENVIVGKKLSSKFLGKIPKGPRYTDSNKLIPYSIVGTPSIFETRKSKKKTCIYFTNALTNLKFIKSNITNISDVSNFKDINDDEINELYDNTKNRILANSKNKYNIKINNNSFTPEQFRCKNNPQENFFKLNDKYDKINKKLENRISHKLNRSKNDLLINKSDDFRIKKEEIEKKIIYSIKDSYLWVLSLKKPSDHTAYVNSGNKNRPMWIKINEENKKEVEMIRKPKIKVLNDSYEFISKSLSKSKMRKNIFEDKSLYVENLFNKDTR